MEAHMTERDRVIAVIDAAIARIECKIEQLEAQRDAVDNFESHTGRAPSFAQRIAAALMRLA